MISMIARVYIILMKYDRRQLMRNKRVSGWEVAAMVSGLFVRELAEASVIMIVDTRFLGGE